MTIGDSIEVPYKLIFSNDKKHDTFSGHVWITDADETRMQDIARYEESPSPSKVVTISIPDDRWDTPYISVHHTINY